jgi:hypothetical protein
MPSPGGSTATVGRRAGLVPVSCLLAACLLGWEEEDCILPPCALPIAIEVTVSSGVSGGSVTGASLEVAGAIHSTIQCSSECVVPGSVGPYRLTLSAPGFQTVERTVVVHGSTPRCSCTQVETERVSLVLNPAP